MNKTNLVRGLINPMPPVGRYEAKIWKDCLWVMRNGEQKKYIIPYSVDTPTLGTVVVTKTSFYFEHGQRVESISAQPVKAVAVEEVKAEVVIVPDTTEEGVLMLISEDETEVPVEVDTVLGEIDEVSVFDTALTHEVLDTVFEMCKTETPTISEDLENKEVIATEDVATTEIVTEQPIVEETPTEGSSEDLDFLDKGEMVETHEVIDLNAQKIGELRALRATLKAELIAKGLEITGYDRGTSKDDVIADIKELQTLS